MDGTPLKVVLILSSMLCLVGVLPLLHVVMQFL